MGNLVRRVLWFLIVAVIVYFAYTAYVRWWTPDLPSRLYEEAKNFISRTTDQTAEQVGEQVKERVTQTAIEYASSVVSEAQGAATRYIKQKASDALSAVGAKITETIGSFVGVPAEQFPSGILPVPQGSGFRVPPPPATVVAAINEPLVFSIASGETYTVSWGDGTSERGEVPGDAVRLLSHAWKAPGDYQVTVELSWRTVTFPVRVYEKQS